MIDYKTEYAHMDLDSHNQQSDRASLKRKMHSISAGLVDRSERISLKTSCIFSEAIFMALAHSQESTSFKQKTVKSRRQNERHVARFIIWLNKQKINPQRQLEILNDYVEDYLSESTKNQRKFSSSGIQAILHMLPTGAASPFLTEKLRQYIFDLKDATKIRKEEVSQTSLSDWIALPQVREVLGNKEFAKLASARILHQSFLASIGHTLTLIQEARSTFSDFHKSALLIKKNEVPSPHNIHLIGVKTIDCAYDFRITPRKESHIPHRRILLHSMLPPDIVEQICEKLDHQDMSDIRKARAKARQSIIACMKSTLFHDNLANTTDQVIIGYLLAALTVQPSDIPKVRVKDIVINKNSIGRPVSASCIYFKGRAGRTYETRAIHRKDPIFKPLIMFIEARQPEELLVPDLSAFGSNSHMKNTLIRSKTFRRTYTSLISAMWQDPIIYDELINRLKATKSSPLFLKAFSALFRKDTPTFMSWQRVQNCLSLPDTIDDYRREYKYSLPPVWPNWTVVKTTAVHASSDRYRENDLTNYNSHTSNTERLSYLTDANKDWVNLHGRVSRIVQYDITNQIYRPSLKKVAKTAKTKLARTVIVKSPNSEEVNIDQFGIAKFEVEQTSDDPTNITVVETAETVVYMLHYLGEAERQESKLRENNPEHFYNEILVRVEWIAMVLESITPKIVSDGQKSYYKIVNALPPLFQHELRAGPT